MDAEGKHQGSVEIHQFVVFSLLLLLLFVRFTVCNRIFKSHQRTSSHFFDSVTYCQPRCLSSNTLFYKLEYRLFGCRSTPHSKQHSYDSEPKTKCGLCCSISKLTLIVLSVCVGLIIAVAIVIPLAIVLQPTGEFAKTIFKTIVFV